MNPVEKLLPHLKALRMSGILDTLEVRNKQAVEERLSHLEFMALVLNDEFERREAKKLQARLRRSNCPGDRTLENFNFDTPNLKLNRAQIHDLATCKSHLSDALGHTACRRGFDVVKYSCKKMLGYLRAGRADGSYDRRLQNLLRPAVLIVDDFGLKPLQPPADEDFYEVVTERYERGSIVLTSNLDFEEWGPVFQNQVLGGAAIDRLRHQAHRVIIEGDSYRKPRPLPTPEVTPRERKGKER
jgi:DNA replication protein DnaC